MHLKCDTNAQENALHNNMTNKSHKQTTQNFVVLTPCTPCALPKSGTMNLASSLRCSICVPHAFACISLQAKQSLPRIYSSQSKSTSCSTFCRCSACPVPMPNGWIKSKESVLIPSHITVFKGLTYR